MPKVTTAQDAGLGNVRSVGGAQLPQARIAYAQSDAAFGGASARQMQNIGQNMAQGAQTLFKVQDQKDALEATDLDMQVQKEALDRLWNPQTGLLGTKGANAMNVSSDWDKFAEDLEKRYVSKASNPNVQKILSDQIKKLTLNTKETLLRHETSERRAYGSEIAASQADVAVQRAALQWNDDKAFDESWDQVKRATLVKAQADGLSLDGVNANLKTQRSNLWTARLTSMLTSDDPSSIVRAGELYDKARSEGELGYQEVLKLDNLFDSVLPKAQAQEAFGKFQSVTGLDSLPVDDVFDRGIIGTESRGRQFAADGVTPLTSSAGAIGIAQVMPATAPEAARLAGLPYDETRYKTDPEYNAALGKAYFKMLRDRYGSSALAALAYNWGMGNVDAHIKKVGDPRGDRGEVVDGYIQATGKNISMQEFLASVPSKEARAYVPKVMQNAGLGMGLSYDLNAAAQYAQTLDAPAQAEFLKLVENQNKLLDDNRKSAQNRVMDMALQEMVEGGTPDWTNVSPQTRAEALRLGMWDKLTAYKGIDNPQTVAMLYQAGDGLEGIDLSDPEIRTNLSQETYQKFLERQSKLIGGDGGSGEKSASRTRKQMVDDAFAAREIEVSGKSGKPEVYARFNQMLDIEIEAFQRENKRRPKPQEMQGLIDQMFMGGPFDPPGLGNKKDFYFDMTVDKIPAAEVERIRQAFADAGVTTPSNAMVVRAYVTQNKDKL